MFFQIEIPQIIDNCQITNIPNPQQLSQQEVELLKHIESSREYFKATLTRENVKNMQLVGCQNQLENYLKTNVDMMRIFVIKKQNHPSFAYQLFLSKGDFQTKDKNTIEEACGCEIVMARYMFSFALNQNAYNGYLKLQSAILSSFSLNNPQAQGSNPDIENALNILEIACLPLQKLCKVMEDLLKSLVNSQSELIPELRMTVIFSFKQILESNANFFFIEKLRSSKDHQAMAKACRSSYSKLNEAYQRLSQQKIEKFILEYCQLGMLFYKLYGLWAIVQWNEKDIRVENYQVSTSFFNFISAKILYNSLAKIYQLHKKSQNKLKTQRYKIQKQINVSLSSNFQLAALFLLSIVQRILQIYKIQTQAIKNPEEIFMQLDGSQDYFEWKSKQIK